MGNERINAAGATGTGRAIREDEGPPQPKQEETKKVDPQEVLSKLKLDRVLLNRLERCGLTNNEIKCLHEPLDKIISELEAIIGST